VTIALFLAIATPTVSAPANASPGTYLPFATAIDAGGSVRNSESSLASYPRAGELFFRLSFDTQEAQVVGYNRQMVVTPGSTVRLDVPSSVTFTASYLQSLVGTGKTPTELANFAGTYNVTAVGPSAFQIFQESNELSATRVLLDQLNLPSTLRVIGADAFVGQCGLTTLTVPDAVTDIGAFAISQMTKSYSLNQNCLSETGLVSLTLGASVERVGTNVFNRLNELTALSFRGPRFPDRGSDNTTILPVGYERWGTSPAALLGGMELNNSCNTRLTYVSNLTLSILSANSSAWTNWATETGCLSGNTISTLTVATFAPAIASAPVASQPSYTTVSLAFTPPTYTGGSPITEYEIETSPGGALLPLIQDLSSPTIISGLTPGTSYSFKIRSKNSTGYSDFSQASNQITTLTATVPADQVAPVASSPTENSAVVSFATPADGGLSILEYEVTANPGGSVTSIAPVQGSPVTIGQLTSGTTYTFTVRARNGLGWSNPSPASNQITTLTPAPAQQLPSQTTPQSPAPEIPVTPAPVVGETVAEEPTSESIQLAKKYLSVFFAGDSAKLTAKAKASLRSIAMKYRGKATQIDVDGFVRRTPETRFDQLLSTQRANAVVKYLRSMGLRASYKAYGRGISPDTSPKARKAVITVTYVR
jgi:outer membrane protein OmpA-like peptidoglycan-associated protein